MVTGVDALVVGVDVGGTKIAAAVVDPAGQIYGRVQHPTDVSRPEMTLQAIAGAISGAIEAAGMARSGISAIGLGIPGKVDPETGTGLVSVNLGWRNVPVTPALESLLVIRCAIENDVRAAALGENYYGAGRQPKLRSSRARRIYTADRRVRRSRGRFRPRSLSYHGRASRRR